MIQALLILTVIDISFGIYLYFKGRTVIINPVMCPHCQKTLHMEAERIRE